MLNFEQIKDYLPKEIVQRNPKGALTEYLQHEFLDAIFKQEGAELLSFMGGTAIRIIYNSQRFSEYLDFDNFGLDYADFKRLMEKAFRELKLKGFEAEMRLLKKEEVFHGYIKFPLILQQYGLKAHHQEKIFIALDAQKKEKLFVPEIKPLNKFGIFRNIAVNPLPVLLAQKLMAILQRKRERGRDFYDVSFLAGLTQPDYAYIQQIIGLEKGEFKEKLLKKCSTLNYKALARDVMPFLFNAEQADRVLNFPATLKIL